ncbi:MAG: hypothetical protein D6688_11055 [Alphaproteobacteria bacterium]|nr:MAG: hypothetical protein D6688_11055 [Alphaproteobacteria bacterium]
MELKIGASAGPNLADRVDQNPRQTETEVAQAFEQLFLGTVVNEVMNTVEDAAMGDGFQVQLWKSFMSDAIAKELAMRGDVGIARSVQSLLGAYDQKGRG